MCVLSKNEATTSIHVGRGNAVPALMQYYRRIFLFQASLETPWFAAGDGCNTTFFYHMNDRSNKTEMGSLAVEVKTVDQTWFMVFRKAGDQGNIWHQGTIDLSVRHLSLSLLNYLQLPTGNVSRSLSCMYQFEMMSFGG